MTREEFEEIKNIHTTTTIRISDLKNLKDRTLIYGYTLERHTFHLYLKEERFNLFIYKYKGDFVSRLRHLEIIDVNTCLPSKRAYPESCDYEFCKLVKSRGGEISYTNFTEIERGLFAGELISEEE